MDTSVRFHRAQCMPGCKIVPLALQVFKDRRQAASNVTSSGHALGMVSDAVFSRDQFHLPEGCMSLNVGNRMRPCRSKVSWTVRLLVAGLQQEVSDACAGLNQLSTCSTLLVG